jgi:hypothetical protein
VVMKPAGLGKLAEIAKSFAEFMPLMQKLGADGPDEGTAEMAALMGQLGTLGADRLSYVATSSVSGDYQFGVDLRKDGLLVDPEELESADVTLCAKVSYVLREGQTRMIGNDLGGLVGMLPEADRNGFTKLFEDPKMEALGVGSPEIRYPGAVVTPIALYR